MEFHCLKATEPLRGDIYFLPINRQEFLVIILSNLEPPSSLELGTPGLGIQCLNQQAIAP